MGKLGFVLSVIMISVAATSLIANSLLFSVINQLRDEMSELDQDFSEFQQKFSEWLQCFPKVEFQTIEKGYYCRQNASAYYVIENESEWIVLWNQYIHRDPGQLTFVPPGRPVINFSNTTVIAVFMGECPSGFLYEIEITEIVNPFKSVVVMVEKRYTGPKCGGWTVITQPYHIVKMNKTDMEITFETFEKTIECP